MNLKYLKEKAEKLGKKLLIENTIVSVKPGNIEVFDKPKLFESQGKEYHARGVLRDVPVTIFDENENGRIYPRELDERIIKERLAEGNLSLADHPENDEGSISKICGVWHNYRLTENGGVADWYLVGSLGQLILETVQAGGAIGVSRVGFGEISELDEKTVIPESYELERLGDAVINPSAGVYSTRKNLQTENNQSSLPAGTNNKEPLIVKKEVNKENLTNQTPEDSMSNTMNEITVRKNARDVVSEARGMGDKVKAQKMLREEFNATPEEFVGAKDIIKEAICEIETQVKSDLQSKDVSLKEALEQAEDFKNKYEVATDTIHKMKKNIKGMDEKVRDVEIHEKNAVLMQEDINQLETDNDARQKDIDFMKEEVRKRDSIIMSLRKENAGLKDLCKENNIKTFREEDEPDDTDDEPGDDGKKKNKDKDKEEQKESIRKKVQEARKRRDRNNGRDRSDKSNPVTTYYEAQYQLDPSISDIKDEILKSFSLTEAIKLVDDFKRNIEPDTSRYAESINKENSWKGNRL